MLKNIPSNQNNETDIRSHFDTFGSMVNCVPYFNDDPHAALLEFADPEAATSAYRSPAAILGNRFIKIYWENPKYNRNGNENQNNNTQTDPVDSTNSEKITTNGIENRKRKHSDLCQEPLSVCDQVEQSSDNHRSIRHAIQEEEPPLIPAKSIPPPRVFKLNKQLNLIKQDHEENIKNQKLLLEKLERSDNETKRNGIAKLLAIQIKKGNELKDQIQSIESKLASGQPNKYVAPTN